MYLIHQGFGIWKFVCFSSFDFGFHCVTSLQIRFIHYLVTDAKIKSFSLLCFAYTSSIFTILSLDIFLSFTIWYVVCVCVWLRENEFDYGWRRIVALKLIQINSNVHFCTSRWISEITVSYTWLSLCASIESLWSHRVKFTRKHSLNFIFIFCFFFSGITTRTHSTVLNKIHWRKLSNWKRLYLLIWREDKHILLEFMWWFLC